MRNNSTYLARFCWSLVLVTGVGMTSFAQDTQEKWEEGEGGIKNVEFRIVKDRQITLPATANRNFEKIPPRAAEPNTSPITYEFKSLNFNTPDFNPVIRPLKLKTETQSKTYGNYVSGGLGNFSSIYGEAFLNTKRDKNKYYGAHLFHQSFAKGPVNDKFSGSGNTNMDLFGKFFTDKITTGAALNIENRSGYFYGYPSPVGIERDQIKQSYTVVGLSGDIENTKPADFDFKLNGGFSYLSDHYDAKESEVALGWKSDYQLEDKSGLVLNADYFLISRKDKTVDANPRHLFKVSPAYRFSPVDGLNLSAGLNIAYENDKLVDKSVHIYPNVWANYELGSATQAYAGLTGDMDKVSLHTLSKENLWLNSNIDIAHTNRAFDLTAGLKGKLVKKLAYDAGFSVARLKNLYYFQNALTDQSKFDVKYDDASRLNLFADLGISVSEKIRFNGRGDYYSYSSDRLLHKPTYRLALGSSFNIYSKISLQVDFITQGGMKALDSSGKILTLDPALDLSAKANYYFSKQFSVFVKLNNLLSSDYPVYYHYPVRGFQAMGGLTWSF